MNKSIHLLVELNPILQGITNPAVNILSCYSFQSVAVWLFADFEVHTYQDTTTFDTSYTAQIPTETAINYTAC